MFERLLTVASIALALSARPVCPPASDAQSGRLTVLITRQRKTNRSTKCHDTRVIRITCKGIDHKLHVDTPDALHAHIVDHACGDLKPWQWRIVLTR